MNQRDAFILTEGDDAEPASSNVVSLWRPAVAEPILLGDLAAIIVSDLAVRLRGDFQLPKIVAFAAGRGDSERP